MSAQIQPTLPETAAVQKVGSTINDPRSAITLGLLLAGIGYFWFRLINNLHLEWSTSPQYGYGWVMPLLCLGLLVRRWTDGKERDDQRFSSMDYKSRTGGLWAVVIFILFAFLYLPTRLIEEATPEWRPIQWALGIEAIGLTLCAVYIVAGRAWTKQLAFPICFFLVAIPWPTLFETPIIQHLARFNASIVVEVLGIFGVPAMQHGNVIEVGTGMVGIDDACSGIRSLQSSLMISLFLGEFYWLRRSRRILLVPMGFLLAILFNACRTSILTLIAAKNGTEAIAKYHDETGITILLACMAVMWLMALLLRTRKSTASFAQAASGNAPDLKHLQQPTESGMRPDIAPEDASRPSAARKMSIPRLAASLAIWLVLVEVGVQLWYRLRESNMQPGPGWSVAFPTANPTFKELAVTPVTRELLRYDQGSQGEWRDNEGVLCQVFYFTWAPGRVAGYLAKRHTPEICLTAVGETMRSGPDLTFLKVHGIELPIRSYEFESAAGPLFVYQCRWEVGAGRQAYVNEESGRYNLIRGVWEGRGINGQKVLEVILSGESDSQSAKKTLLRQLDRIIKVSPPRSSL